MILRATYFYNIFSRSQAFSLDSDDHPRPCPRPSRMIYEGSQSPSQKDNLPQEVKR